MTPSGAVGSIVCRSTPELRASLRTIGERTATGPVRGEAVLGDAPAATSAGVVALRRVRPLDWRSLVP